jgi:hypothetical protein
LAGAGAANAQGTGPFFKITSKSVEGNKVIAKERGATLLYINATVTATQSAPSQLTDQFRMHVAVTKTSVTVPNGWSIGEIDPPARDVKAGEVASFTVTVSTTLRNPDVDTYKPEFRITSTPVFGGAPNPVTDTLVSTMSQTDTTTISYEVSVKLATSEKIVSFVKRYPWFFLLAAGGLFVLGVVLVRKRKGGVGVSTDSPVQQVLPGRGASYPIQVRNEGGQDTTVSLTTSAVPGGWSAILPLDKAELGPNESTTLWLTLKSPPTAHPGEHVQISFVATSADGASSETLLEAVVVERYGGASSPEPADGGSEPQPLEAVARPRRTK